MNKKLQSLLLEQARDSWVKIVIPHIVNPIRNMADFGLTLRERALISLKLLGFTNEEIAQLLKISISNVKTTLSIIKRKLGIERGYKIG